MTHDPFISDTKKYQTTFVVVVVLVTSVLTDVEVFGNSANLFYLIQTSR